MTSAINLEEKSPDRKLKTQHPNTKSRQLTLGNTAEEEGHPGHRSRRAASGSAAGFQETAAAGKQAGLPASSLHRLAGNQDGKPNVGGTFLPLGVLSHFPVSYVILVIL